MILETERLRLRPWTLTEDDVAAAFRIYGDPEVMSMMGLPLDPDLAATRTGLTRIVGRYAEWPGMGLWAVKEVATGAIIGSAGIKPMDGGPEIEIGYHLARAAWGKGYATEVARALVDYGFSRLGLTRIVGVARPENQASRRVLQKAGLVEIDTRIVYGTELVYHVLDRPSDVGCQTPNPFR